jgi:hypothetical protein
MKIPAGKVKKPDASLQPHMILIVQKEQRKHLIEIGFDRRVARAQEIL